VSSVRRFMEWREIPLASRERDFPSALRRAKRLDERLHAFVEFSPADGSASHSGRLQYQAYAAKDLFVTSTHRSRAGLKEPIALDAKPATALSLLDGAGARCLGFTAMTELAYEPSGYNAVCERARNPWNLDAIPGGSSSGSAVAVASGSAVFALGSDTGGSIRIPAHCCGVTGWKPTWGSVSADGVVPLAPFLDCVGLLARSAADLPTAADVLLGPQAPSTPVAKIAVAMDALSESELPVRRACEDGIAALETLARAISQVNALGAMAKTDEHALVIMQAEAARTHAQRLESGELSAVLSKRLAKGLSIEDTALAVSRALRPILAADFEESVLGHADALILPVMPLRTPVWDEVDPASPRFSGRLLYELSRFCRFVNMLGWPAVAVPVGFDDRGLPVAMQIVGRAGSDRALIALAQKMQSKTDWHARVPAGIADLESARIQGHNEQGSADRRLRISR
jgi:aspartyl-tRNA(Asn)/glutamyl-tRNA(Gln) amidotransferase subunit A